MTDPYKVLGISPNATDDEVKKAYRELARKYHPDNYRDSDLAEMAGEKMKEINEAYDTIQAQRSGKTRTGRSYGGGTSADPRFADIRSLINQRRYSEAEMRLDSMSNTDRGAEWNFLKACVLVQRGHFFDAQRYIETACYMDPDNEEYRNMRDQMNARAATARRTTAHTIRHRPIPTATSARYARRCGAWTAAVSAWAAILYAAAE